jgi:hypothetical protein
MQGCEEGSNSAMSRSNAAAALLFRRKGDGSTLNLDFTGGSLDPRVVLTRSANTATYINSSGYVTTAAQDVARFDYDPTTLAAKGLLIEGQAINIALYSQSINSSISHLVGSGTTLTQNTTEVLDPANGNTATKIALTASTYCSRAQIVAVSGSTQYTFSYYIRGTPSNQCRIYSYAGFSGDLVTLTNHTYTTNSWTRVTTTFTTNAATTGIYVYICSRTAAASPAEVIYVWGAQLETGTAASSYIPTTTAQVTRNPDLALMTTTNFSSWFTGGTTGTFFVDFHGGVRGITSTVRSVISTDDIATKHLHLQQVSAAGALRVGDRNASPNYVTTGNSLTSGARTKGAFSFAYPGTGTTSTVNLSLNGGTVATSSALLFSVAPTWLVLGGTSTDGSTLTDLTTVLNGSIRQIKYYPTALTSAQLIAMTT